MSTLDSSIVNLALPYIMADLSGDMGSVQWVVTVYLMVVSSLLLTFGRLSDILGRPRVYRLGFGMFTLGSFCCGLSGTLGWLVLSRALQAVGASMLMACSPAIVVDVFEPENRGKALGLVGACVASGLTLGPVTGGLLLEYFSWPIIFYINIPVGLAALVYSRKVWNGGISDAGTSPGRGGCEKLDLSGSFFMVGMVAALVMGLIRSPEWGFFSLKAMGCWGAGAGAGAGLFNSLGRAAQPLIDPGLFRIRLFIFPLAAAVILFMALFTLIFMMPFYLTLVCRFSPALTGLAMIVPFLVLLVVSPLAGSLADRLGSRRLCLCGMGCLALALVLSAGLSPLTDFSAVAMRLALAGLGTALFISPNSMVLMGAVPADRRGIASGAMATARNMGMVAGVALASGIFSHTFTGLTQGMGLDRYTPEMAPLFMAGFRHVMAAGAGAAVLGMGVTLARGDESGWKQRGHSNQEDKR
ncbi:MAG: MFS transporter [Desulfobacter sp.]|nr:MAG: MFS transporter [Desulfobacter sp.]